jgi:hypothetical protein
VIGASDALSPPEEQLTMKTLADSRAISLKSLLRTYLSLSLFLAWFFVISLTVELFP